MDELFVSPGSLEEYALGFNIRTPVGRKNHTRTGRENTAPLGTACYPSWGPRNDRNTHLQHHPPRCFVLLYGASECENMRDLGWSFRKRWGWFVFCCMAKLNQFWVNQLSWRASQFMSILSQFSLEREWSGRYLYEPNQLEITLVSFQDVSGHHVPWKC